LVQQQVLLEEADKLGIRATNDDVRAYLHTGATGEVLFPTASSSATTSTSRSHLRAAEHVGDGV
jgi:hypothetical protein